MFYLLYITAFPWPSENNSCANSAQDMPVPLFSSFWRTVLNFLKRTLFKFSGGHFSCFLKGTFQVLKRILFKFSGGHLSSFLEDAFEVVWRTLFKFSGGRFSSFMEDTFQVAAIFQWTVFSLDSH